MSTGWSRRRVLAALSVAGAGPAVFGRALSALAAGGGEVTTEMIRQAEWIAGLTARDRSSDSPPSVVRVSGRGPTVRG